MEKLMTVLRAAQCRSTHHYFALDGLRYVETQPGSRLRGMLLRHHDKYLAGAKAPDTAFRDFQNHVLHVSDHYWGGAVLAAETWLSRLVDHLQCKQWSAAAYAAGVLSHYVTDPCMPLHTGQSSVESIVHRPMEWSIFKSYDSILALWDVRKLPAPYYLVDSSDTWLRQAIIDSAENSHQYYHTLISLYDVESGVKNPPTGLNQESRQVLSGLVGWTIHTWGQILDRVASMLDDDIPSMPLSLTTVLATLDMPLSTLIRKIGSMREQVALTSLLKEYQATGTVVKNLPKEVLVVRSERLKDETLPPPNILSDTNSSGDSSPITIPFPFRPDVAFEQKQAKANDVAVTIPMKPVATERFRLSLTDDVIDAPSIGPKTAARLAEVAVKTVSQLLNASPETLAARLSTNWITPDLIRQWQAQANLVCTLPEVRGLDAQLLVAVSMCHLSDLASADAASLSRDIARIAETSAGQRIVRSSPLPDISRVQRWIQYAQSKSARRSA